MTTFSKSTLFFLSKLTKAKMPGLWGTIPATGAINGSHLVKIKVCLSKSASFPCVLLWLKVTAGFQPCWPKVSYYKIEIENTKIILKIVPGLKIQIPEF